jgi:hypothetical protein
MRLLAILLILVLPSFADAVEVKSGCACNLTGVCDCGPKCSCSSFVGTVQPATLESRVAVLENKVNDIQTALSGIQATLARIDRKLSQAPVLSAPVAGPNPPTATVYYSSLPTVFYSTDAFGVGTVTTCANGQCTTTSAGVSSYAAAPRVGPLRRLFGRY